MLIQMIDGQGIAVERSDHAQFRFAVAVKVGQDSVAGRAVQDLFDLPVAAGHRGRREEESAFFGADQGSVIAAVAHLAVTVILEHVIHQQGELKGIAVIIRGKVIRKDRAIGRARPAPVVLIFHAALDAADDQIVGAAAAQDAETMYERSLAEGAGLPFVFGDPGHDLDPGLEAVIGGIELTGGEELSIRPGNRCDGHDAAHFGPDGLQLCAVLGEQVAGIVFFCRRDKAVFSFNSDL